MKALADLVDGALEVTVAPSFLRVGSAVRSRLDGWKPVDQYDVTGRVMVVTGATSGLGLATVRALASAGATVEIVARNEAKAAAVCDEVRSGGASGPVGYVVADLSELDSVRAAAAEIADRHDAVDVVVHNAGALDKDFARSSEGFERTVAGQVIGPFLLTDLLLPLLRRAPRARVLWMSSGGMYSQPLDVDALEMTEADYDGTTAYARAKRAQVTLSELWAQRLEADGIVMHAMHPGWADTPGVQRSLPTFRRITGPLLRSAEDGADTMIWLAADDGPPLERSGQFWLDRRPRSIHRLPSTRRADTTAERARLWAWCVERAGTPGE